MSGAKYKDWILETIDALRKRKARPDLERICHILERKHGLSSQEVKTDLSKLVVDKVVIKVDYKGSVSYRNAAKWRKSGSFVMGENSKRDDEDKTQIYDEEEEVYFEYEKLSSAQSDSGTCALNESDSVKNENNETSLNPTDSSPTSNQGDEKLEREVPKKRVKLSSSDLGEKPKQRLKPGPKPKWKNQLPGAHNETRKDVHRREKTPSPGKRGRGPKRKRIAKTHGPDFESYVLPHKLAAARRNSFEENGDVAVTPRDRARCDFCLLTSQINPNGQAEDLLICKDCQAKAHPSCMDYSEELARRARTSPWQCIDCKTCYICQDSGDADAMLFCDSCDKGYHMECHQPPIFDKPTGKWVCSKCQAESVCSEPGDADDRTILNGSLNGDCSPPPPTVPTPRESPIPFSDRLYHPPLSVSGTSSAQCSFVMTLPSFRRFASREVPDATGWSVDEVVDFIFEAGFRDESEIFREQEIDGKSLLLMRRSDVLQGLSIKLGPALKIFAHIQRLQTKGNVII